VELVNLYIIIVTDYESDYVTAFRTNATSIGRVKGQPATSTLLSTQWQSITCHSTFYESLRSQMLGYVDIYNTYIFIPFIRQLKYLK